MCIVRGKFRKQPGDYLQFTATGSKIQTNLGQQSLMLKCELGEWASRKNKRNDLDNEIHVYYITDDDVRFVRMKCANVTDGWKIQ